MKKLVSILTICAMLICSINICFVYANPADSVESDAAQFQLNEYDVKLLDNGDYVAYNIATKDLEVYVTDGYNPVADAEVTIAGLTAMTDENGIVFFEDIPTSEESYDLMVNSSTYGMHDEKILLSGSQKLENENQPLETAKYTISFWQPDPEQEAKIANAPMPLAIGDVGTWSFDYDAPENTGIVEYYGGYIYVIGDGCKAYDIFNNCWITLSGSLGTSFDYYVAPVVFCNGYIYTYYASYTADGEDDDGNEYYRSSATLYRRDVDTGDLDEVYHTTYGGKYYGSVIGCNGKVFYAGGYDLEEDGGGLDYNNTIDTITYSPYHGTILGEVAWLSYNDIAYAVTYGTDIYYFETTYGYPYYKTAQEKFSASTYDIDSIYTESAEKYIGYTGETGCAINDSETYFVGGEGNMNGVRYYDYDLDEWYTCSDLKYGRKNAAVEYHQGKLYILGGYDDNGNYVNYMEIYDISKETSTSQYVYSYKFEITDGQTCVYGNNLYAAGNGPFGSYGFPIIAKTYYEPQYIWFDTEVDGFDSYREQTLAISDNNIYAWGEGYFADGTDSMATVPYPQRIDDKGQIKTVKQVCRGKNHNLVLDGNGNVWGWGSNTNYPLGNLDGKVKTVTKLSAISNVKQVAAGAEFSIFLKNDGTLWGVGKNDVGQLGQGLTSDYYSTPVRIAPTLYFDYVDASEEYVVAITTGGKIYTWGGNMKGQLGNGGSGSVKTGAYAGVEYDYTPKAIDITLPSGETFEKVAAGINFCLALTNKRNVYAWGNNGSGQLGQGNKTNNYKPYKISTLSNITDIAAGRNSALATKNYGETVYGWGEGRDGQLGFSASGSILSPTEITSLNGYGIIQISCGDDFTTVLSDDGYYLYSFGNNANGALGILK